MWKIKEILRGISNFWRFKKEVYNYKPYEYEGSLELFAKGLEELSKEIIKDEASSDRLGKYADITKATYCLRCLTDPEFIESFRKEYGREEPDEEIKKAALKQLIVRFNGYEGRDGLLSWWI